jgi:hypothetical protein
VYAGLSLNQGCRKRDLALFNLAIDSKLRGCDVFAIRVVTWRRAVTRWIARPFDRRRLADGFASS